MPRAKQKPRTRAKPTPKPAINTLSTNVEPNIVSAFPLQPVEPVITTRGHEIMDEAIVKASEKLKLHEMPLNNLPEYLAYNREARRLNKILGICRHPVKQCPQELHPQETIILSSGQQPTNPVPVFLSNEMIEFKKTLIPGKKYKLPSCVVQHLATRGSDHWDWFENADGSRETRVSSKDYRFGIRTVHEG